VLEIGSGAGEHAVHFAAALSELSWQCCDRSENLPGIRAWLDDTQLPNTQVPLKFDVASTWPGKPFDAVCSANTLHSMSWSPVQRLFARLPTILASDAIVVIHGPFNHDGPRSLGDFG
jgi:cyclopropane fatty-acyl-phospholipid synthase-like methyltransferase